MTQESLVIAVAGKAPSIHPDAYVDVSARIIGDVTLGDGVSVWPMAVLRADTASIHLAQRAAVLDLALIEAPEGYPVVVDEEAILSHGAILHGATLEPRALIGIGAIVLDGAIVSTGSIIGAGSVVSPRTVVPPNSLVLGIPGKVVRETSAQERARLRAQVQELYLKSRQMAAH
jgi:carbonic anhydrase/acetyltransferase-like protein (isoleucine patch superfamily)